MAVVALLTSVNLLILTNPYAARYLLWALGIIVLLVVIMFIAFAISTFFENRAFDKAVKCGDIILDGSGGWRSKDGMEAYIVCNGNLKTQGERYRD